MNKALCATLLLMPSFAIAQAKGTPSGKGLVLTEAQQIASAILPLPKEFRADAQVLGYKAGSKTLSELRPGKGAFTCLATDPTAPQFHVACYHKSMEPFMLRGRQLREQGVKGDLVDSARFREVREGKLKMPQQPAALYEMTGPVTSYDPATNTASKEAKPLFVVYIAGATEASTGLSAKPLEGGPWIMYPGTPKAHIMIVPKM